MLSDADEDMEPVLEGEGEVLGVCDAVGEGEDVRVAGLVDVPVGTGVDVAAREPLDVNVRSGDGADELDPD